MRSSEFFIGCVFFALVVYLMAADAALQRRRRFDEKYLRPTLPTVFFHSKENQNDKAVFETQCSGSGCTFNGCESSGSETCDGQMFTKLNAIQTSINNFWKRKQKATICKQGWKRYDGHCYHFFSAKMNWFQAYIFCRNQGTTLLRIDNANESKWIMKTFPNVEYWIDFTDNGMEGKWVSLTTGKNEYTSWYRGQPDDNAGKENCAINNYGKSLERWNDVPCNTKFQVMCEASDSEF